MPKYLVDMSVDYLIDTILDYDELLEEDTCVTVCFVNATTPNHAKKKFAKYIFNNDWTDTDIRVHVYNKVMEYICDGDGDYIESLLPEMYKKDFVDTVYFAFVETMKKHNKIKEIDERYSLWASNRKEETQETKTDYYLMWTNIWTNLDNDTQFNLFFELSRMDICAIEMKKVNKTGIVKEVR